MDKPPHKGLYQLVAGSDQRCDASETSRVRTSLIEPAALRGGGLFFCEHRASCERGVRTPCRSLDIGARPGIEVARAACPKAATARTILSQLSHAALTETVA